MDIIFTNAIGTPSSNRTTAPMWHYSGHSLSRKKIGAFARAIGLNATNTGYSGIVKGTGFPGTLNPNENGLWDLEMREVEPNGTEWKWLEVITPTNFQEMLEYYSNEKMPFCTKGRNKKLKNKQRRKKDAYNENIRRAAKGSPRESRAEERENRLQ